MNWADISPKKRTKVLFHLSKLLLEYQNELAKIMAGEIGKPLKAGCHEVNIAIARVEAFCKQIPSYLHDEIVFEDDKEQNLVRHEPIGTVAVISPWNAPVFLAIAGIIPPLLCGNKIIWKPSEHATKTSKKLAGVIKKLEKFGLPKGVFTVRYGGKDIGEKLVKSDVQTVALTGSLRAGQAVMRNSAEKMHRLILEFGGKDPAIVLEDADIEQATKEIVKSATMYSGQVCFGVERVYCHQKIYKKFVNACLEEINKIKVGDPFDQSVDMGPMSVKFQYDKVLKHLQDAKKKGAKIFPSKNPIPKDGIYIAPTLLTEVSHKMLIMKEETFGPVLPIMKFSKIEQAIKLANDSVYGLTASVWTKDLKKGKKIAKKIEAGTVEINRHGMSKAGLPWGGYKLSGLGRIYSKEGIRAAFTNTKHIWTIKQN